MELSRLGVVDPRLCDSQRDLMLGVVDGLEVVRHRCLNEVPQLDQRFVPQDRVVCGGRVAHVWACLLALDERNLFLRQVTVKLVDAYRCWE